MTRHTIPSTGIFAFIFLTVALLGLEWYINTGIQTREHVVEQVQQSVDREISNARQLLSRDNFLEAFDKEYPLFIYEGRKLIFWNSFDIGLAYPDRREDSVYYLENDFGKFIVCRAKKGADRVGYALVVLERTSSLTNEYITSYFNPDIFPASLIGLELVYQSVNEISFEEKGLFSISASTWQIKDQLIQVVTVIVGYCLIIVLILIAWQLSGNRITSIHPLLGLGSFIAELILIRTGMLWTNFPERLVSWRLFDARLYASSWINPSLGALFTNAVFLFILVLFVWWHKRHLIRYFKGSLLSKSFLFLMSYGLLFLSHFSIRLIFFNSQLKLDLSHVLDDLSYKVALVAILALFLISFVLLQRFIDSVWDKWRWSQVLLNVGLIIVPGALLHVVGYDFALWIALIFLFFYLAGYVFKYRFSLVSLSSNVIAGLVLSISIFGIAVTHAVFYYDLRSDRLEQESMAVRVLNNRDVLGEFLLFEAVAKIKEDVIIKNRIFNPFAGKGLIRDKIERVYLGNYFDKYEVQVLLFNAEGEPLRRDETQTSFERYRNIFQSARYQTTYDEIRYIPDPQQNLSGRYLSFIELERYGRDIGKIIIDLNLRKFAPGSAYPQLLVDRQFNYLLETSNLSYAIFDSVGVEYTSGNFNYYASNFQETRDHPKLYTGGMISNGFFHVGAELSQGRKAVVSRRVNILRTWLSNFSFFSILFLILMVLTIWLIRKMVYRVRNELLALKIQFFTLAAIFASLLLVVVISISLSVNQNQNILIDEYRKSMENAKWTMLPLLEDYYEQKLSIEELSNELSLVAENINLDLNLYLRGQLLASSQPLIFDNHIISRQINPQAYQQILSENKDLIVENEEVGRLQYISLYQSLRSTITGDVMGIINIPFYEDTAKKKQRIVELFGSTIIIILLLLITLVPLSYVTARQLTYPLQLLAEKINTVSFARNNEPLQWSRKDEVGLLVREYNAMLQNLEFSREALKQKEKETAWREMARQVAHEIKNPLTPMKLSIQHLQRTLDDPIQKQKLSSILDQIETINDIATSFSAFAKMPVPKSELYDLKDTVVSTLNLLDRQKNEIHFDSNDENFQTLGDPKLMGRIFFNIMLNGIQAVPASRTPELRVRLLKKENEALVTIEDNGAGIDQSVRQKIFIPNFTTKEEGSGIGLAIAKRGIEYAGGKIWFETSTQGSIFYIELPLAVS